MREAIHLITGGNSPLLKRTLTVYFFFVRGAQSSIKGNKSAEPGGPITGSAVGVTASSKGTVTNTGVIVTTAAKNKPADRGFTF